MAGPGIGRAGEEEAKAALGRQPPGGWPSLCSGSVSLCCSLGGWGNRLRGCSQGETEQGSNPDLLEASTHSLPPPPKKEKNH